MIEHDLLSMKHFFLYTPPDVDVGPNFERPLLENPYPTELKKMVIDGISLTNLEIVANNVDSSTKGTLYSYVNHCKTKFGSRMMLDWICSPLCDADALNQR